MIQRRKTFLAALLVLMTAFSTLPSFADEGMWTFDNPPRKQLKDRYGFEPTQEWLDHIRLASVRFNDGGSGSFISANGLVMTNHHVALGQLQKVSSAEKDYVKEGFFARTAAEEMKCPDLELNVLVSMENVTEKILGAMKPGMTEKEMLDARKAATAEISKKSMTETGLRSDVVSFYQGSEYWLYRYKKYTDVRLVMAPEQQIAFYGGDPDNFTFPRYDLDMAYFRVYENDKPVQPQHFLKWKSAGAQDGELVFVSGHPGSTSRLQTFAQTEYQRDYGYPLILKTIKRRIQVLKKYELLGAEQERRALSQIFGLENAQKALTGEYEGLLDKNLIGKKQSEEKDFRDKVNANPEWKKEYGWAWDSIASAIERQKSTFKQSNFRNIRGRLFSFALTLVQYSAEIKKPNGERLPRYQDANLPSLKFQFFSPAPVYSDLEEIQVADGLNEALEELGTNDVFVTTALGTKSPEALAKEIVGGTKLADPTYRKALFENADTAIAASADPMIVLAKKVEPILTDMRKWNENNVAGILASASEKIGKARFIVYGKTTYPDATFTLRLSYGTVKGYPMNGTKAPAKTTLYGLYDRALSFDNTGDFKLPKRFLDGVGKLNLTIPFNFVSTCDIIGGNSGSPVVNKEGELVGLIFDGNIESLPGRFLYSDEKNRAVAVNSGVMIECMRKLYDAGSLADEIEGVVAKPEPPKAVPAKEPVKPAKKKK